MVFYEALDSEPYGDNRCFLLFSSFGISNIQFVFYITGHFQTYTVYLIKILSEQLFCKDSMSNYLHTARLLPVVKTLIIT